MKHISEVIKESQNKMIQELNLLNAKDFGTKEQFLETYADLTDTSGAIICSDCMHGNHEVSGHSTCECACHGNPQCFVCGRCLLLAEDRREGLHNEGCLTAYEQQEANREPNEPFGRYPWER